MFSNTTEYNVAIRSFGRSRIVIGLVIAFSSAANAAPPAPLPAAMAQPLLFEPNVGQTDARAHWVARGPGYQLFFTDDSVMMTLLNPVKHAGPPGLLLRPHAPPAKIQDLEPSVVRLRINGSHRWTNATGLAPVTSVTNYLIGNDRSKWHTNVANFTQLKENHIYDGVDIVFSGNGANLEYDFIVAPGADPAQIHLAFDGIDRMRIEKNGDLCLTLSSGKELKQLRPRIYQQIGEQRLEVTGNYKILDRENVTFALARYDRSRPLIIDPSISFSSKLMGEYEDWASGIALDSAGNAYVAGWTQSLFFPVVTGFPAAGLGYFHGGNCGTACEAFVAKFSPSGAILFSTYLGGSGSDMANGVAVDATGVYVTGYTTSQDFPQLYTPVPITGTEAFVTNIIPAGNDMNFSKILGPGGGFGIVTDHHGNAYVTGAAGGNFPQIGPQPSHNAASEDVFVAKIRGFNLAYSIVIGGSGPDEGRAIAVDQDGNVVFTGYTSSPDLPVLHDSLTNFTVGSSSYVPLVGGLDASGNLRFLRYLDGHARGYGTGIALDPATGDSFVVGWTYDANFPTITGTFDRTHPNPGHQSGFIARVNSLGVQYWGAFFGLPGDRGDAITVLTSVAVGPDGNVYVGGNTTSNLLIGAPPLEPNPEFGFVSKLWANAAGAIYTVRLGAYVTGVAAGSYASVPLHLPSIKVYTAGMQRTDGPTDSYDVVVTKLDEGVKVISAPF